MTLHFQRPPTQRITTSYRGKSDCQPVLLSSHRAKIWPLVSSSVITGPVNLSLDTGKGASWWRRIDHLGGLHLSPLSVPSQRPWTCVLEPSIIERHCGSPPSDAILIIQQPISKAAGRYATLPSGHLPSHGLCDFNLHRIHFPLPPGCYPPGSRSEQTSTSKPVELQLITSTASALTDSRLKWLWQHT